MKVKIDENLPTRVLASFVTRGHDTDTVHDEGLAGAEDPAACAAATEAGRLVVTLDRGFGDLRLYPPGTHAGILVLRMDDQSATVVVQAVEDLLDAVDLDDLSGCIAVYRDGDLRVRRPS